MSVPLPQEFPRDLALLRLNDVLPDLPPGAREPYAAAFEVRRANPLHDRGILLAGEGGLRPLMALMRLMVLGFRDINLERFPEQGSEGRLLTAYVRGEHVAEPLPTRAGALFIERADRMPPALAPALGALPIPLFATWEGGADGPVWEKLRARCDTIFL